MFAAVFVLIFLLHLPVLRLPYFWDEAGYYIPAARDILLSGSLIPRSTVSNAHPPLVMTWVALWWRALGYAPIVTRTAMLALAAFTLLGVFRLAERVANTQVAIASTLCTAVYPVFFAQTSLEQVDLAAAGMIFWGLYFYAGSELAAAAFWFSMSALAKETSILAPLALAGWEAVRWLANRNGSRFAWLAEESAADSRMQPRLAALLTPVIPLAFWYAYHYARTGHVFGNPEFFRYNVQATLSPTRFVLALGMRLWQALGYLHLWVLTLPTLFAMCALSPRIEDGLQRPRIGVRVQMMFYVVAATYVVALSVIGGAVLARYMLPAVPLVIIVSVATLWRRMKFWRAAVAGVAAVFVLGWFWNPRYGFSPEDNLAYRDYIQLHQNAEKFLETRYPMARVLTAWPASDELVRPWLGYVTKPMRVVRVEDFSLDPMLSAAGLREDYDVALIFSTKYEPGPAFWDRWQAWTKMKTEYFGFHRDLSPAAAARLLGGRIVFSERRQGQWIDIIEIDRDATQNARARPGTGDSTFTARWHRFAESLF